MKENIYDILQNNDTKANVEVKTVEAYVENAACYLSIKYKVETESEIFLLDIPKAILPLDLCGIKLYEQPKSFNPVGKPNDREFWIKFYDNTLILCPDKEGHCFYKTVLFQKKRKMTVAEIEKALGYEVEIVNNK